MSKLVKVEGRTISVPDDATPDEIDQIANPTKNPSDTIPKAKAPIPEGLRGPAPSSFRQLLANLPGSMYKALETGASLAGAGPGSQDVYDPNFKDPIIEGAKSLYKKLTGGNAINDLISSAKTQAIEDPVNTALMIAGGAKGLVDAPKAIKGAGRAAINQVRPVLSKANLIHPLKMAPDLYDAGANIIKGAREAVNPPTLSPFDRPPSRLPSSGGSPMNPKPTGIKGDVIEHPADKLMPTMPGNEPAPPVTYSAELPEAAPAYRQLQNMGKISKPLLQPSGPTMSDLAPVPLSGPVQPSRGPGSPGGSHIEPAPDQFRQLPTMPKSGPIVTDDINLPEDAQEPSKPLNIDDHETVKAVKEATENKIKNITEHLKNAGMDSPTLERLGKQAEDTQNYALLDALASEAYESAKAAGKTVPKTKYKSMSGDTLRHIVERLK